jgi:hypothetical protein
MFVADLKKILISKIPLVEANALAKLPPVIIRFAFPV